MRRVVENRTNDLLDLIAEALKGEGAPDELIAEINEIKKSNVFEKKLEVAQNVHPMRLIREGSNPVKSLYSLASQAIHGKSEEECIDISGRSRARRHIEVELRPGGRKLLCLRRLAQAGRINF